MWIVVKLMNNNNKTKKNVKHTPLSSQIIIYNTQRYTGLYGAKKGKQSQMYNEDFSIRANVWQHQFSCLVFVSVSYAVKILRKFFRTSSYERALWSTQKQKIKNEKIDCKYATKLLMLIFVTSSFSYIRDKVTKISKLTAPNLALRFISNNRWEWTKKTNNNNGFAQAQKEMKSEMNFLRIFSEMMVTKSKKGLLTMISFWKQKSSMK